MPITRYNVAPLPERRVNRLTAAADKHLSYTHTTLEGIFDSLHIVRVAASKEGKDGRGRFREGEVDLLRAALVLAGAGLDAVVKRLARDTLPKLLAVGSTQTAAHEAFKGHVAAQVQEKRPSGSWTKAILADDPRQAMIEVYVGDRTQGSLQSVRDLKAVRNALGIEASTIPDVRITDLTPFLTARNQVAHDLDIKDPADQSWGQRNARRVTTVVAQCDLAVGLADAFVVAVSDALGGPPALGRPKKAGPS